MFYFNVVLFIFSHLYCLFFFSNNSDDLEEDCFEGNLKQMLDFQSPLQPNAHLYCYASNLDLPEFENNSGLDPKTQKY